MSKVDKDEIRRLAKLSKIKLSEEQIEEFASEIDSILGYVSKLSEVDTKGLKPTTQVTGLVNVSREDEVIDYKITREQLLELSPDSKDGFIKVKRVL
jgi:aspartyl-tRNA(Asn)/glutamyl-tRNA(Gln) amidotransferase subunit C